MSFVGVLVNVASTTFLLSGELTKAAHNERFKRSPGIGDACELTNGHGRCELLDDCQPVYRDSLAGIEPDTLCGFFGYDPIVCCPRNVTISSAATMTSQLDATTSSTMSGKPTGHLARRKCAEYASSVYGIIEPPILSINRKSINVSLCGIKSRKLIVGGTRADTKEFPHMAAVGFGSTVERAVWLCGATLVSDKFVITAAHCTYSLQYGNAGWVRVGDLNLVREDDDARPQDRRVVERIRNPAYKKPSEYHDIALLRLDSPPIIFDAYARPACLPTAAVSSIGENIEVVATGWGSVNWADDGGSNDLLKVTIVTVSQERCNASYAAGTSVDHKLERGIIDDWQICAGQEGRDTCQGDSGGPIVVFNPNHECMYDVVGITSLGRLCGSVIPGVYTRVQNYISWLENTIWR